MLITHWINFQKNQFVEVQALSGFVFFEVLKNFVEDSNGEVFDKLYGFLNSNNFDLDFLNKIFYNDIYYCLDEYNDNIIFNEFEDDFTNEIFNFYKKSFIIYAIVYYRNNIVHKGEIMKESDDLMNILNKINSNLNKNYLKQHLITPKTVNDFKYEFQEKDGSFWEGFRKGFKIVDEIKKEYSDVYNEEIKVLLVKVKEYLNLEFENYSSLIDPIVLFDNFMTLMLLYLLDVDCNLLNYPKFRIDDEFIDNSKEYVSRFLINEN